MGFNQDSGSGMKSRSSLTLANRSPRQSDLACSIRSFEELTKFHQIVRSPSIDAPPSSITFAAVVAVLVLLLVAELIIVGMVLGTARDQDLSVRRIETVQAFFGLLHFPLDARK